MSYINLNIDAELDGQNACFSVSRYLAGSGNIADITSALSGTIIVMPDGSETTELISTTPGSSVHLYYDDQGFWIVKSLTGNWLAL